MFFFFPFLNYIKCLLVKADGSKNDEVPHFMEGQIKFCSDSKFLKKEIENISNEIRQKSLQLSSTFHSLIHVLLISETKRREATNTKTQAASLVYRIITECLF